MDSDPRANPPRSLRPQEFLLGVTEPSLYHPHSDLCAMAAKKTTPKSAPQKGKAKPVAKPSKPAPAKKKPHVKAVAPAKKPSVKAVATAKKPAAKAAAPAKKPAVKTVAPAKKPLAKAAAPAKKPVVKAAAPAKKLAVKATAPAKKSPPKEKVVVEKSVKKEFPAPAPVGKTAKVTAAFVPAAVEAAARPIIPAKKIPAVKPRSSVVDFPAPPAPVRPPFVPPKAASSHADGPVTPGSNGSHSASFVQKQRQRLLDLRDDLVDAVSGMARDTIRNAPEGSEASGSGQHQGDAGSDAYDRDFALSVLAKEQDALYEIEQALYRIKNGSYGICEISSRKIPQARLEAIPFARLTVECQAQWEKEYGNRRFRPSNEVGFSGGNYVDDEDSETVSLDEDDD
jgi:RNA polymerase-binding transcription factor DksA